MSRSIPKVVQIRRLQGEDAEAVKKLITGIVDGEFREEKSALSLGDLENLEASYGNFGEAFFVAEEGRKIIGTVAVKREDNRIALLRRIFVAPEYRMRQIGLRLLDRAIEFCKEVGYRELIFKTTSRMSAAIELVKKRGFQSRAKVPLGQVELLKFSLSLEGKR